MNSSLYIFFLLLLSALWGSTFFWTKILLVDFHPVSIVFFRCLLGVIVLLPILIKKRVFANIKLSPSLFTISLLGAAIPWTLMTISLQYMETTLSGVINALTPLFGMVLSIFILKNKARPFEWICILIGFFGVVFIFLMKGVSYESNEFLGALILLIATLSYAMTGVISTKYQKHTSPYILAFMTLIIAMLICGFLMMFIQQDAITYMLDWNYFFVFFVLGVLSSGLGYVIFYTLVAYGGPVYALFITYLMPTVALFLGYFFLDEKVTWTMLIGLIFIFTSIGLMNFYKRKERLKYESAR